MSEVAWIQAGDSPPPRSRVYAFVGKMLRRAGLFDYSVRVILTGRACLEWIVAFGLVNSSVLRLKIWRASAGNVIAARLWRRQPKFSFRAGTTDVRVLEDVFVHRQYDFETRENPSLIVDGGAHIGCASVFFARKYPRATIIAVEPESRNFELLRSNVSQYQNILAIRAAIWGAPTTLRANEGEGSTWAFRMNEAALSDGDAVLGLTMNEILEWVGSRRLDILKLDIEGAERHVFSHLPAQWIGKVENIVIELHDRFEPGCRAALVAATGSQGFAEYQRGECTLLSRQDSVGPQCPASRS